MVDKSDISDAIVLFEYSQTARVDGRAPNVIRKLWDLFKRNEIGPDTSGKPWWHHGSFDAEQPGFDLLINPQYINHLPAKERLGALSLVLVHEGVHATVHATVKFKPFYSELAARILPIHYYQELSGPGVFNEADDPPQPGKQWGTIRIQPSTFSGYQRQSDWLKKDQLLDYILSIKTYRKPQYIDAEWIIDKLQFWGGLKNRWTTTRGLYIRLLAETVDTSFDHRYPAAILDVMESVDQRQHWTEMMKEAGALHTIQLALARISTSQRFSARIVQLERKWGVRLT